MPEQQNTTPQPAEPPMATSAPSTSSSLAMPRPRNKKRLIIFGSIGVVVLLILATVGALAYYNNPNKVLGDALANTISAKSAAFTGTIVVDGKEGNTATKATINLDGKGSNKSAQINAKAKITSGANSFDLSGDFVTADKTAYLRLTNIKQLLQTYVADPATLQLYLPIVEKLDNTWIQLDDDSSALSGVAASKCQAAFDEMKLSDQNKGALKQAFEKYQFIKVTKQFGNQTIRDQNSIHYQLAFDEKAAEAFTKEAIKIEPIKKVDDACNLSKITTDSTTSATDTQLELWIDTWTHKPTKIMVKSKEQQTTVTTTIEGELDVPVSVQRPTDAKPLKQIMQEIQQLFLSGSPGL